MTEREKEYVCDQLCRYPYQYDDEHLEPICEKCLLNKSRSQLRKEYMQEYYKRVTKEKRRLKRNEKEDPNT